MRQWAQKPANPKLFYDKEIPFAFTMSGLKSEKDFLTNIKKAIHYGLPKTEALKALTTHPAQFINKSHLIGSLEVGAFANFIVASGDIFEDNSSFMNIGSMDNLILLKTEIHQILEGLIILKLIKPISH